MSDRRSFGHEVLGPVVLRFMTALHAHLSYGGETTSRVFVARAGVRIHQLYERYCAGAGFDMPQPAEIGWMSRLLLAKGTFLSNPDTTPGLLVREFAGKKVADVFGGLWRYEPSFLEMLEDPEAATILDLPADAFAEIVEASTHPLAHAARSYFEEYEGLVGDYLGQLAGGNPRMVLVDSGWQGTIHRMIALARPELDVVSLLFGRILRPDGDHSMLGNIVGLVVESDAYDPSIPESAIVFHRHIIEHLFEVDAASIEVLSRTASGSVDAPQAFAPPLSDAPDEMLQGVVAYLDERSGDSMTVQAAAYDSAIRRLHDVITRPTSDDIVAANVDPRSADFGRDLTVDVLLSPEDRFDGDSPALRIEQALWPQGQVVIEFEGPAAAGWFDALSGVTQRGYFADFAASDDAVAGAPTVAVVTRTKNRPVLLVRAADSVAKQTYRGFRWVVVNDGGDESEVRDVIETSGVPLDKVTLVSNSASVGMEAASNLGVRAVESDYVVIHDDDDSWDPRFLEVAVGFLESDLGSRYGGVVTHTTYISEEITADGVVIHDRRPYNDWLRDVKLAEMSAGNTFAPIAFVYRRSIYDELDGYAEKLPVLGDWDFNLRFLRRHDIGVVPEPLANYHHRDVNASGVYANSVVGGRDLHAEFDGLVRNQLLRSRDDPTDPLLSVAGYLLQVLRSEVRGIGSEVRKVAGEVRGFRRELAESTNAPITTDRFADDVWAAFVVLANRTSQDGVKGKDDRPLTGVALGSLIDRLIRGLDPAEVPMPADFDEAEYLRGNPDVRDAIVSGAFMSGYHHYLAFGRQEGRERPTRSGSR